MFTARIQKSPVLVHLFIAAIFVLGALNIAPPGHIQAQSKAPLSIPIGVDALDSIGFDVKPDIDMISGWEWPPDTEVTISVPARSYSTSTTSTPEGDVDFPPLPVDIQVGDYVEMTDGVTTKYTIVVPLTFGSYDLTADTVTGTANPYVVVWGFTCNGFSHDCASAETTANAKGKWLLDFSGIGIEPGSDGGVYIWDADGDATSFMWRVPRFSIMVNDQVLHGIQWNPYSEIEVYLDGALITTGISNQDGMVEIANLKVKPDQKLKLTDGMYTKKHVVQALKITSVDPFTDKVKGTADPGTVVTVTAMIDWGEEPAAIIPVTTKADGTWLAKFTSVGWDIQGDSFGVSEICDNDGDCTAMTWESPPDDISPDYGEKLTTSKVTFDWPDEPGADLYKFQLSTHEDFSTLIVSTKMDTSFYAYDVKLLNNTTYYWRIRPFFGDEKGVWSLVWKFTSMDPLTKPTLVSPSHKQVITDSTPYLDWYEVTNGVTYMVQVSNVSDFSTIFYEDTVVGTSRETPLLPNGKYFWRVRAFDLSEGKGPWSEIWIVKIDAP